MRLSALCGSARVLRQRTFPKTNQPPANTNRSAIPRTQAGRITLNTAGLTPLIILTPIPGESTNMSGAELRPAFDDIRCFNCFNWKLNVQRLTKERFDLLAVFFPKLLLTIPAI